MKHASREALLQQELKRITETIICNYKPEKIILFGSLASGNVHEWSDIDLAIIKHTASPFLDRLREVALLTRPKVAVNVVVYTPEEVKKMAQEDHYFWVDEIEGKGKVVYEQSA